MREMLLLILLTCANVAAAALDTAKIDQITGLKGKLNEKENAYKITFPRDDVKVTVDGWTMPPFMGLGTWASFTESNTNTMVMGDTVLFKDEVNTAMSAAIDNGLHVTALHNHFFFDRPKVFFMHIEGEGSVEQLAGAVHTRCTKSMMQSNRFARQILSRKRRSESVSCPRRARCRPSH